MSGANWLREGGRIFSQTMLALIGWLVLVPLVWLVPRQKNLMVIMGRNGGKFTDNSKYFYLQAQNSLPVGIRCMWLTSHRADKKLLEDNGLPVLFYPSVQGVWLLVRAGVLVVDSCDWYLQMRRFLLSGARKIQLWHGVGFKQIEGSKVSHEAKEKQWISGSVITILRLGLRSFTGRHVRYDLVNTTSRFYLEEVFRPAFASHYFLASGYPRNSFSCDKNALLGTDTGILGKIETWHQQERRIVLVVPTFRESRPTPLGLDSDTCRNLDAWCALHQVELVFKFHPWERGVEYFSGKHLHIYDAGADLYPLIGFADAMISDYSSIYMDFLLLDKPVLFLVPDMEEYIRKDRQIQFDYNDMTPGPKVKTWPELLEALEQQWKEDGYRHQRHALVLKAFDELPQEKATEKILQLMQEKNWIATA